MLYPLKVVDIELSQPIPSFEDLDGYIALKGLVRLHGVPLGYVQVPISLGRCTAATLSKIILEQYNQAIVCQLLKNGLASPQHRENLNLEELIGLPPVEYAGEWPLVTVAVCTRDRPEDMKLCLEGLSKLDYPNLDVLVVDNAPQTEATKELVETHYPFARYVREPRPGLDWARNRAIVEAKGEILAYTDDDVVVDRGWVKALATVFAENVEVMAVTGLVVPYELETEAQVLFEMYGGFGRGFDRRWHRIEKGNKLPWQLLGTGQFGTGANMAYRRCIFEQIGYFDPALDVGTATNGGGDLEMFFRVIKAGHTLVYEPSAMIRHRHRREYAKLKTQITNNGALYTYFLHGALTYPDERSSFLRIGIWWVCYWYIRRLLISFLHPQRFPRDLIWAEIRGGLVGLTVYQKARKQADKIAEDFGEFSSNPNTAVYTLPASSESNTSNACFEGRAVRQVELTQPLDALTGLSSYSMVRVFVKQQGKLIGSADIHNQFQEVSAGRLREAIVSSLNLQLLELDSDLTRQEKTTKARALLSEHYRVQKASELESLPGSISVSIVLCTRDRPDDLRNCLQHLTQQQTNRSVEIIVVDNHPDSNLTPPVVAEFSDILLISESRAGLAYARNAGIAASTGDIIVATDDDVTVSPGWLETLVAPFARKDVMAVTGNVLPLQLDNGSQWFFEQYGGLGKGFARIEVNGEWFEGFQWYPVPTWTLGATANAAFRASIFSNPAIGLMEESLGPGMPTGVGEDSYLFYKVLKAGYTIIYEPKSYVWHKHRTTLAALRRQIYNYSKGHIAHHLTTLLRDNDWRGLRQILVSLPRFHVYRIKERFLRRSDYPVPFVLLEIAGNLAGPWSLWMSHQRVKREGRSTPYVPAAQRKMSVLNAPVEIPQLTSVSDRP